MRYAALALVILGACGDKQPPPLPPACEMPVNGTALTFRLVPNTRGAYLLVTSPRNDLRRFAIDQGGRVRLLEDGGFGPTLLDISGVQGLLVGGELGLLGIAFHPKFATNRQFFVYYTTANANIVARYEVSATDPNFADPATGTIILSIPDFAANHNGGMMEFGSDGFLYIGTGDGGGGGDPMMTGQDTNALLGKMLRIDVDRPASGKMYGIPPSNPFASGTGGAPEVFIIGLRNPWRWSFDRATGDLYIGDVGQDQIEELTILPAGKAAGANLGWRMYEGERCFDGPCDPANKIMPQYTKTHADGWCSVIGGVVYRGGCYPDLVGSYFFTDYCAHGLVVAKKAGTSWTFEQPQVSYIDGNGEHIGFPDAPTSMYADARGEIYLTADAGIFRLEVVAP